MRNIDENLTNDKYKIHNPIIEFKKTVETYQSNSTIMRVQNEIDMVYANNLIELFRNWLKEDKLSKDPNIAMTEKAGALSFLDYMLQH